MVAKLAGTEQRHVVVALGQSAGKRNGKELGTFKQFLGRPCVNAHGDVAFVAMLTNSEAIPGGIEGAGLPLPAGVFVWRRGAEAEERLRVVALARDPIDGLGMLDFSTTLDPLQESTSRDLLERTPALTDAGVVAFTAATFDELDFSGASKGAVFVATDSAVTPRVKLGDPTPFGLVTVLGAPAMNAAGLLAFRGATDETDGIFTFDGTTLKRLAGDFTFVAPFDDPANLQQLLGFGDLVALNDAGDVAFAAGGLLDNNLFGGVDLQFGTVLAQGGSLRLLTYPGQTVEGFGRVRGGSLGPEGGNDVALPSIGPDGTVYVLAQLNGTGGHAFFRSRPPEYDLGVPLVVFGGSKPDPSPIGGVFFSAVSTAAVDTSGSLAFFARLAGAPELEALIFRPTVGDGNAILVGQATPTDGKFGGPPFSTPAINDNDVVVFKSAIARGPSALGLFRWQRGAPEKDRLSAVVRTGDPAPPGGELILDLPGEPSINASGDVAFAALVFDGNEGVRRGIFAAGAAGLRRIAMPNDPLPFVARDAQIETIAPSPLMLADGSVAFRATYAYEDPLVFSLVRLDGVFRVAPSGEMTIPLSTALASPDGSPFFRFRDPNSTGGAIVVRALLGESDAVDHRTGLFLLDPSAAIRLVITDRQPIGNGPSLDTFSGRATVDAVGNVAFLARVGGELRTALVHRTVDGESKILAMVGGSGPTGGQVKNVGRPTMSSNGHLAFRAGFERGTGGNSGFYLKRGDALEPFVVVDEADSDGVGDRLNGLNPNAALNASDHLAFIATESAGDSRNGIFFAAPTTTGVSTITVSTRERDVDGIPTLLAKARGRVTIQLGDVGKPVQAAKQAVKVTLADAEGVLFTGTRQGRRVSGLRKLSVKRKGKRSVRVSFASTKWEFPFRSRDQLRTPFTVRVDVGVHGGTAIVSCKTAPGGQASCP